ncbi:hypothetical protein [Wielerella bovis]|uniref:hypothetical protein n=1 Tax=Wielerella bovis TaxID=2917790 RepID=UPI002019C6D6|nr:hypothetical protein [Wielerella bovis]ULJ62771.1 hypothetical protein MIS46_01435 [Wielerella bovis]ULJ65000.1 hypothetical protein MIS33_01465 [Wielerella bovis]ULJ67273.1 hypothetical protein MIS31_01470 [Wielerella bovis]
MKLEKKQFLITLAFMLMSVGILTYEAFSNPIPRNIVLSACTTIATILFSIRVLFEEKMNKSQQIIIKIMCGLVLIVGFWGIFLM